MQVFVLWKSEWSAPVVVLSHEPCLLLRAISQVISHCCQKYPVSANTSLQRGLHHRGLSVPHCCCQQGWAAAAGEPQRYTLWYRRGSCRYSRGEPWRSRTQEARRPQARAQLHTSRTGRQRPDDRLHPVCCGQLRVDSLFPVLPRWSFGDLALIKH